MNILIVSLQHLCSQDEVHCFSVPEFFFSVDEGDCILMLPYAAENIRRAKESESWKTLTQSLVRVLLY